MKNHARQQVIGILALTLLFALTPFWKARADLERVVLRGNVPPAVARLTPTGRLPATNRLSLAIGLPLRNRTALQELLAQLYDAHSTNFHKFLTPSEFTARFGPTERDYQEVIQFAETNGLVVQGRHAGRMVLDVEGGASEVERAFHVTLRTYKHPTGARSFFAPDVEPSVPTNLPVVMIEGLNDYSPPRPLMHKVAAANAKPLSFSGSGPNGEYAGNDFRNAYAPGTTLNGAGQSVGLLEFSDYYKVDITNYENTIGRTNYVPLINVVIGSAPDKSANDEVALDIEMAISMAPGLSNVIIYEIGSNPGSILTRMADDDMANQLSSSWSWTGGPDPSIDSIFQQMAAEGQSFFQASGDSDAYTGSAMLDNSFQTNSPVDNPDLTCVGGTTLTMNGPGTSWFSETVWNYNLTGTPNQGSGGGISSYYSIPYWQTNVSMAANSGSTNNRNIPDVALTADDIFVSFDNGDDSGNFYFVGTSCAAPLWAAFCALVNQQSLKASGTTIGFLNPALYAIAHSASYNACFHDITTGNNIGTGTPGLFNAVTGYDLCTGLGTPNGTNLINALAPLPDTTPHINGIAMSTGAAILSLGGAPNFTYVLQGTTNLLLPGGWQPVATNTFGATGVWHFTNVLATNFTQRFYRLELP